MTTIREVGEFGLISRLAKLTPASSLVMEGIGDDCAVLRIGERIMLVSTDLFIEDVHFRTTHATPEDLGWKAAAAGISDVAAMGGMPLFGLVSLSVRADLEVDYMERFYKGLNAAFAAQGATLVGGDTTRSADKLVVDVIVIGEAINGRYGTRKGARPGDVVAVTGPIGLSAAGLHALENGHDAPALVDAHHRPQPRVREGQWLLAQGGLHAMIDITDGLAQDVGHLAEAGRVGANLLTEQIPIAPQLQEYCAMQSLDPLQFILTGGEDYELAMALDPVRAERIVATFQDEFDLPLTIVGAFGGKDRGVRIDGKDLTAAGFNHFSA